MRLSSRSRYGTRLILDLAYYAQKEPVSLSDVSKRQDISEQYLTQLALKLKSAGLIKSTRGAFGGYMLDKPSNEMSIGDIVRTLEKTSAITDCAETEDRLYDKCNKAGDCITRSVWIEASKALFKRLDEIKIANLINSSTIPTKLRLSDR